MVWTVGGLNISELPVVGATVTRGISEMLVIWIEGLFKENVPGLTYFVVCSRSV